MADIEYKLEKGVGGSWLAGFDKLGQAKREARKLASLYHDDIRVLRFDYHSRRPEKLVFTAWGKRNPGRGQSSSAMYELFYSSGGHGGPFYSIGEARRHARNILAGSPYEKSISIKLYSSSSPGGFGRAIDVVTHKDIPEQFRNPSGGRSPHRKTDTAFRRRWQAAGLKAARSGRYGGANQAWAHARGRPKEHYLYVRAANEFEMGFHNAAYQQNPAQSWIKVKAVRVLRDNKGRATAVQCRVAKRPAKNPISIGDAYKLGVKAGSDGRKIMDRKGSSPALKQQVQRDFSEFQHATDDYARGFMYGWYSRASHNPEYYSRYEKTKSRQRHNFETISVEEVQRWGRTGQYPQHVWFVTNQGDAAKAKVNGRPKVWKTRPGEVELSLKYGMYEYAKFTEREIADGRLLKPVSGSGLW